MCLTEDSKDDWHLGSDRGEERCTMNVNSVQQATGSAARKRERKEAISVCEPDSSCICACCCLLWIPGSSFFNLLMWIYISSSLGSIQALICLEWDFIICPSCSDVFSFLNWETTGFSGSLPSRHLLWDSLILWTNWLNHMFDQCR